MIKMFAAFLLVVGGAGAAIAQSASDNAYRSDEPSLTAGRSISATGRTMPKVGLSKGEGTTDFDRGVQRRDDQIQHSICSNC